jgi:hypothetical protein
VIAAGVALVIVVLEFPKLAGKFCARDEVEMTDKMASETTVAFIVPSPLVKVGHLIIRPAPLAPTERRCIIF